MDDLRYSVNERSGEGKKIYVRRRIFIAVAVFFVALVLRWAPDERIPPFDDLYHAKRIAFSAQHFPHVLEFDRDRGLAGAFCPWPPLYDLTCAALSHVVDVRWLPPVGFALFAALISVGRWPFAVGRGESRLMLRPTANGQLPTVVLGSGVALAPYLVGISRTSHIDHHWVEPMLMLAIVFAARAHRGVLLGIAIAAALFVQPAFIVAAALAFVALYLDGAHRAGFIAFAIAAVAVAMYAATRPAGYLHSAWFLGWPHAAVLIGGATAFAAASRATGNGQRAATLLLGALVALAFPMTATAFLTGSSFFGGHPWLSTIVEFQPMFHDPAAIGTDLANLTGGALLAFVIIRRERTVALFAIAYLVLALTSRRFLVPGIALFVLAGALAMLHARTRIATIACAALTLVPPLAYTITAGRDPWPRYDHIYQRAEAVRRLPPGRVLAPWWYGHAFDVIGEHPVVIDNFGSFPNALEFDDATLALHAGGRALERYVRAHGIRHVIR